jgi:hypothetical protein
MIRCVRLITFRIKKISYSLKVKSIMAMKKVSITCAHCGKMFQIEIAQSGVQHSGKQHSMGGCGRITRVYTNNGNITKTEKA